MALGVLEAQRMISERNQLAVGDACPARGGLAVCTLSSAKSQGQCSLPVFRAIIQSEAYGAVVGQCAFKDGYVTKRRATFLAIQINDPFSTTCALLA